jgi:putative acetyltransferase
MPRGASSHSSALRSVRIRPAEGARDLATVRRLFREYERSLSVDLCFQGFESELRSLPGSYVAPGGVLLLGRVDGRVAGCAALRPGPGASGEMKRLFVRPAYRRSGVGRALVGAVADVARTFAYRDLVLDTLPEMVEAHRLYVRLGFREVPPFVSPPLAGMRYFRLDLRAGGGPGPASG